MISDPLFPWEEIRLRYAPSPLWVPKAKTVSELDSKLASLSSRPTHGAHPQLGGGIARGVTNEVEEMEACARFLQDVLDSRTVDTEATNPGIEMSTYHTPVLADEVLDALSVVSGGVYVDATLGGGGHTEALLKADPELQVLGIDQDRDAIEAASRRLAPFGSRFEAVHANFEELGALLEGRGLHDVDGILFDLGVSSHHFDTAERGFSFRDVGPLDMRMDQRIEQTAADILNTASQREIARILKEYGEERHANKIATRVLRRRATTPLRTTADLIEVLREAYGHKNYGVQAARSNIHPATRTFQALRIAVNRELEVLDAVLPQAFDALADGGRLVVIAFHSLEDRIVKRFMRNLANPPQPPAKVPLRADQLPQPKARLLNKKPITAAKEEIDSNRRARSAKLRALEKLHDQSI